MKTKKYFSPEITVISIESCAHILAGSDPKAIIEPWEPGEELKYEEGESYQFDDLEEGV